MSSNTDTGPASDSVQAGHTAAGKHATPHDTDDFLDQVLALAGPLNVNPLVEAIQFAKTMGVYMDEKKKIANDEPVFRVHAGVPAVVATDTVSASFCLRAPLSVLDREPLGEEVDKFGPLGVPPGLIGNAVPALLANAENNHPALRKFTVGLFKARMSGFQDVFDKAIETAFTEIVKPTSEWNTLEVSQRIAGEIMYQWILGVGAPSPEASIWFGNQSASYLQTDAWASNSVFQLIWKVKQGVSKKTNDKYLDELINKVKNSRYFSEYKTLALRHGVPIQDLESNILYVIQVNASFPLMFMIRGALTTLHAQFHTLDQLRGEIGNQRITKDSIQKMPLLDSFYWELQRLFIRPSAIFRQAQEDFELPAGNGKHFAVKKGELVYVFMPFVHRDPKVWEDPEEFNAHRFRQNPDLKKHVFNLGFDSSQDVETAEFGCAAEVIGMASAITKMMIASCVKKLDWELDQAPDFSLRYLGAVGPDDLGFTSISSREQLTKKKQVVRGESNLV